PRERLAYSMGLLQTSAYLGISAGPVLGGVIAEAVGIRGSFFVAGALLVRAGLVVWQLVHEHFPMPSTQARPRFLRSLGAGLTSRSEERRVGKGAWCGRGGEALARVGW